MYFRLCQAFLLLLLYSKSNIIFANGKVTILAEDKTVYTELIKGLENEFKTRGISYSLYLKNEWPKKPPDNSRLLLTIGTEALLFAGGLDIKVTHYASAVPRFNFDIILTTNSKLKERFDNKNVIPLFLEQPIDAYLALANKQKKIKKIIIFHDSKSVDALKPTDKTLARGLTIQRVNVSSNSLSIPELRSKLEEYHLVILQPGKFINTFFLKWLFNTAFEQAIPVFAYSSNFLKAGAAVSIETDIENLHKEITDNVIEILDGTLPASSFSSHIKVGKNNSIIRRLGLEVPESQP